MASKVNAWFFSGHILSAVLIHIHVLHLIYIADLVRLLPVLIDRSTWDKDASVLLILISYYFLHKCMNTRSLIHEKTLDKKKCQMFSSLQTFISIEVMNYVIPADWFTVAFVYCHENCPKARKTCMEKNFTLSGKVCPPKRLLYNT